MGVFRRRTASPAAAPAADSAAGSTPGSAAGTRAPRPAGKGRPTPKRREAQRSRRTRSAPPRDRKEAARRTRERARLERREARAALVSGDERRLPPRDAGPVRRLVRDYVDARRTAGEYFIWVALLGIAPSLIPDPRVQLLGPLLFFAFLLVVVVNSALVLRGMLRLVRARFPEESTRGLASYALLRVLQLRRLRLPPPKVRPGATL